MGANERRHWSSLIRHEQVQEVVDALGMPGLRGVAVVGPSGIGKTTLASRVEEQLGDAVHLVRLFGSRHATEIPYGAFSVYMARLKDHQHESPLSILQGVVDLIRRDAQGRRIVVVLDDLPGVDTASVGVLMQLVLGGMTKLLVLARSSFDLPQDLGALVKDGLLSTVRLGVFSRAEVRTLLTLALEGAVAETVVCAVHEASDGNPLVLQALVNEYIHSGALRQQGTVWVLFNRCPGASTENILPELVEARLARESPTVRAGLAKLALLRSVPLPAAMRALGAQTVVELEEAGFLAATSTGGSIVTLAEPYLGEILRAQMSPAEKVEQFRTMSSVLWLDPTEMTKQQLLSFAAWVIDAGLQLKPEVALAAGRAAIDYFDPQLALRCCEDVPDRYPDAIHAAQIRSRVFYLTANYPKAVSVLEDIAAPELERLSAAEQAAVVMDLTTALLWVPGGYARIEAHHAQLATRLEHDAAAGEDVSAARKTQNLAHFEYLLHSGALAQVAPALEEAMADDSDLEYRLNCASMLTAVWSATGRELDAITLAATVTEETELYGGRLQLGDWNIFGLFQALLWSGQWRACEAVLRHGNDLPPRANQQRSGVVELTLGSAYVFAGRGADAVDTLLVAAAQLEVRDVHNSLRHAHAGLAMAYAQINDVDNARKYLDLAEQGAPATSWMQNSTTEFFRLMALRWLDDPQAVPQLIAAASADLREGRFTTAATNLFGATVYGTEEQYRLLLQAATQRQGTMAAINVAVAEAVLTGNASRALEAADHAHALELSSVESRCAVLAVDLARRAGEMRLAREAQVRLERLLPVVPVLPVLPQHAAAPLTPRERQVAALAIRGLTNRDIADQIGVSVRTVEGHLYQVFAKLGITSRAELEQGLQL